MILEGGEGLRPFFALKVLLPADSCWTENTGQSYVYHHMCATIGTAAGLMDWVHEKTPESEEIQIIATLFPKDQCRLKFTPREVDQ